MILGIVFLAGQSSISSSTGCIKLKEFLLFTTRLTFEPNPVVNPAGSTTSVKGLPAVDPKSTPRIELVVSHLGQSLRDSPETIVEYPHLLQYCKA